MRRIAIGFATWILSTGLAGARDLWTTAPPGAPTRNGPNLLLIYDMEGLSGQDRIDGVSPSDPAYPANRKLLTDDVNATIDGLFRGGASSVTVLDGHGGGDGSLDIDVLADQLDPRAKLITYKPFDLGKPGVFDGVAAVGQHAKAGSGGFAAHTWTAGVDFILNGHSVSEVELLSLSLARAAVPVIFVSGDDRLAAGLAHMPWIEYVEVKKSTGFDSAELVPLGKVHAEMRERAARAVKNISRARVTVPVEPMEAKVRAYPPSDISWLADMPGIDYRDGTVTFTAATFEKAYKGMQTIGIAGFAFSRELFEAVRAHPDGKSIENRSIAASTRAWAESEKKAAVRSNP